MRVGKFLLFISILLLLSSTAYSAKESKVFSDIDKNALFIPKTSLHLSSINISVINSVFQKEVELQYMEQDTQPMTEKLSYEKFRIDSDINGDNLNLMRIYFKISEDELRQSGADRNSVVLEQFRNGWVTLDTHFMFLLNQSYHYYADAYYFGAFSISADQTDDVRIEHDPLPLSVAPGRSARVQITVQNNAVIDKNYTISVDKIGWGYWHIETTKPNTDYSFTLKPYDQRKLDVILVVSKDVEHGLKEVTVSVTDGKISTEFPIQVNIYGTQFPVDGPGISVELEPLFNVIYGEYNRIRVGIKNNASSDVRVVVSAEGFGEWADYEVIPSSLIIVPARNTKEIFINIKAGETIEEKIYNFTIVFDIGDKSEKYELSYPARMQAADSTFIGQKEINLIMISIAIIVLVVLTVIFFKRSEDRKMWSHK